MIVALSEVPLVPETRERALDVLASMAAESRAEAGVVDYRVTTDVEEPNVAHIVERYEDEAAFDAHENSAHLDAFQSEMAPLIDGEATLYRYAVEREDVLPGP
ncbi:quinol monooxygenase YgiN [Halarchaeum solikamskense]|uniref:putative quinol monooxygenase n=1 Tax=Halarchaeum nitratireducens TaxID=489913 RepID=UPI001B3A7D5A|nr:quinol monooxygenase YgiN [Halarchaeum solikamskense]